MDKLDLECKKEWKRKQREQARQLFPLPDNLMEQLFNFIDEQLEIHQCDHSWGFTEAWLTKNNQPKTAVLTWLEEHGGYCDCEVLSNAADHWEQNR